MEASSLSIPGRTAELPLFPNVLPQDIFFHGLIQKRRNDQGDDGVGQHVGAVIDDGIELRTGECPLHKCGRDQNFIDGHAADIVDQEAPGTAHNRARKNAPLFASKQPG